MKKILISQMEELAKTKAPSLSTLSNLLAALFWSEEHINWAGLYLRDPKESGCWLGPFQGKAACFFIPEGKGVISACLEKNKPLLVEDVLTFKGHIACDSASRSEAVLPLYTPEGEIFGVLDLDSEQEGFFRPEDLSILIQIAEMIQTFALSLRL